jgi:hypothetical protein
MSGSSCGCCDMRPRTHDDVPTGNVGRGLRAIPRDLELEETRSSDSGCSFEDAGPVRPEDCFPVPSLSVVRGWRVGVAGGSGVRDRLLTIVERDVSPTRRL